MTQLTPSASNSPIRILIVEDEPTLRESCASVLEHDGYAVKTSGVARAAENLLRHKAFDRPARGHRPHHVLPPDGPARAATRRVVTVPKAPQIRYTCVSDCHGERAYGATAGGVTYGVTKEYPFAAAAHESRSQGRSKCPSVRPYRASCSPILTRSLLAL